MAKIEITPETLAKMIADGVAAALANAKAEAKDAKRQAHLVDGKTEKSIKNEIAAVKAFKKAGFGDVKPHVDIMTYNRWVAAGRKVKAKEHAIKVGNLRLFHISQTEVISADDKAAEIAKQQEAIRAWNDKKKALKANEQQAVAKALANPNFPGSAR